MKPYASYRGQRSDGCLPVIIVLGIILAIILFIPFVLMLAWNTVMPYLFGLPTLEYPQAFALWLVFTILTGVIRGSTTSKG